MENLKVFLGDYCPDIFFHLGIYSNVQLLLYIVLPLVVFSLCLIVVNGMFLKKNLDMGMIVVSAIICVIIGISCIEPLNNFVGSFTFTDTVKKVTPATKWLCFTISKEKVEEFNTTATIATSVLSLIHYFMFVAAITIGSIIANNMFVDGRTKDSSQGIKAVLGGLALCVMISFCAYKVGWQPSVQFNTSTSYSTVDSNGDIVGTGEYTTTTKVEGDDVTQIDSDGTVIGKSSMKQNAKKERETKNNKKQNTVLESRNKNNKSED